MRIPPPITIPPTGTAGGAGAVSPLYGIVESQIFAAGELKKFYNDVGGVPNFGEF
jgi:hypothetical protein